MPIDYHRTRISALAALAAGFVILFAGLAQATVFQGITDRTTYDVGSKVNIRLIAQGNARPGPVRVVATVRYRAGGPAGSNPSVAEQTLYTAAAPPGGYVALWTVPANAQTGRYDVDLHTFDPVSGHEMEGQAKVATFAVYRKLVSIEQFKLDKPFYTSGDPVGVTVRVVNLSSKPLTGLRVEFSDRYWPWIGKPAAAAQGSIVALGGPLNLAAAGTSASSAAGASANAGAAAGFARTLRQSKAATAPSVDKPSLHQYGVIVWDASRRDALDIAFSPIVLVNPPGQSAPRPYSNQYLYPDLSSVNVKDYRHFYTPAESSAAVIFDHNHTMFTPGATASVTFHLTNSGFAAWQGAKVEVRLTGPGGVAKTSQLLPAPIDLAPGAVSANQTVSLQVPQDAGLYNAEVRVTTSAGEPVAAGALELAVNPLPKSVMIFCAHEDDEGGWDGYIRALAENNIPVEFVYFTSGDAGACDKYYQRSCGAAEALNFGEVRMQETRAVLGHLGLSVPMALFLGLPDGGSGEIWYHHTDKQNPYRDPLLAVDRAPYESLVFPNLPYARDAVVQAAAELIRRFRPEAIVTAHPPQETHIDHIVNGYFAIKALHELARQNELPPNLQVLVDRVYVPKEAPATPYRYEEKAFYVTGEAAAVDQEAGWYYQSQGGNQGLAHLREFDQLPRKMTYRQVVNWMEQEGWNEHEPLKP